MTVYIFILVAVMPSGLMEIKHSILPTCPEKVHVEQFMNEKVKSGEIIKWAGTCAPLENNTTEL